LSDLPSMEIIAPERNVLGIFAPLIPLAPLNSSPLTQRKLR
jgi:hypothetical protein